MRFRKLGLVYCPDGSEPLMRAFAMPPTPVLQADGTIRVYFASTDNDMVGRAFFVDLAPSDPCRILRRSPRPVLDAGKPDTFDRHGVNPTSVVRDGTDVRLYYVGYCRSAETPYTLFTGLALSRDGEHFVRAQDAPIEGERFFRTAPNVHRTGGRWRMWYVGGGRWTKHEGKPLPVYGLRYAESDDGIVWGPPRALIEPDEEAGQIGFGRPYVMPEGDGYRMFLSIRTVRGYSISHARSHDGLSWHDWRHDIIPPSNSGWDSEMCCYAAAVGVGERELVFYNGNGYGRTGFGVAVRER
jgi:hypothetical protein